MIIRKSIDLIKPNPYPGGYQAPSTAFINGGEARLHIKDEGGTYLCGEEEMPPWIQLRFLLNPILLMTAPVNLTSQAGETMMHGQLYQESEVRYLHARHQAIELRYTGFGRVQLSDPLHLLKLPGLSCQKDQAVCHFEFQSQQGNDIHINRTIVDDKVITTPPGMESGYPLWCYGGYYRPGCSLAEIEQIFFSLEEEGGQLCANLLSSTYFKQRGIIPPQATFYQGVNFAFVDFLPARALSLKDHLLKGGLVVSLDAGCDETGEKVCGVYESFDVSEIQSGAINVAFKLKGE